VSEIEGVNLLTKYQEEQVEGREEHVDSKKFL